jgi:tetratricopeptide (TPR) repeat protein
MSTLVIQHVGGSQPAEFQVVRLADGRSIGPVGVPSPVGFPVEGRPQSGLMRELRWYLEEFLDYPFPPETDHAARVQDALKTWGEEAFLALFGQRETGRLFDAATAEEYAALQLRISSDDPAILYWPWKALCDPEAGVLARTCQVQRQLNRLRDPHPISDRLPRDRVNILLVTARPLEGDVRYRSISRPLVDQIDALGLPATVTVLRPPTFDRLRAHLRERPHHYHILHFDGHGAYGGAEVHANSHAYQGPQGQLLFEDDRGGPDPQPAGALSELLRECSVPVVVLNACQSAMVDERADDAFASVAAGLLRSGVRSVVAMAYSLYVSGAQQFLPAFYRRLFESGRVAEATRAGRQQMVSRPQRVCARGEYPLEDWLVPVLYEQDAPDVSFAVGASAAGAPAGERAPGPALPPEARDAENPYGFIGRGGPLLDLERAMRRPPAGILVRGLGGVGKTTLARGFVQWLAATDGLGQGCFWFSFQEIRSAEFVFNEMVGALFGTNALAAGLDEKIEALIGHFRRHRFLIVWDNFEVVRGIPEISLGPTLSGDDRRLLLKFLRGLRGALTKVLITSRSEEAWLDSAACYKMSIGGLVGEERWEYCETIVRDLGLTVDRADPDWKELVDLLEGHPLAMRVVLPRLQDGTPRGLMERIQSNLAQFASEDEESAKLFATLGFARDGLPEDLRPLLVPLALHERFVHAELLERMARQVDASFRADAVERLTGALGVAGLVRDRGERIHEMHPALGRFLRLGVLDPAGDEAGDGARDGARDAWCRAFVDVMGRVADQYAPRELHEQRPAFQVLGASFRSALAEAERLGMDQHFAALIQSLAAYAQNERDFRAASDLFARLAEHSRSRGDHKVQAGAYHQLGRIAEEHRDFAAAEVWYRKSLAIFEKQGNEQGAASSYHQLGMIAEEQRDFAAAEAWYRKSLAISEKQGDEHGAAGSYHQLGRIAAEQRDFAAAEAWYRKSLAIFEKQGNEHGAAITYAQLGLLAARQEQHEQAGRWSVKAHAVFRRTDPHSAQRSARQFQTVYQQADQAARNRLETAWREAGLGDLPEGEEPTE